MPHAPMHTKQYKKNLVLLAILLAVVGGLFAMTLIKVGG